MAKTKAELEQEISVRTKKSRLSSVRSKKRTVLRVRMSLPPNCTKCTSPM